MSVVPTLSDGHFLFASEAVTEGHPDRLCDLVSDAVLDACLIQDPDAQVACQACTKSNMVMILGHAAMKGSVKYEDIIRETVKSVGYDTEDKGMDWRSTNIIVALEEQSISLGFAQDLGLEEQGCVFGYASDETAEYVSWSHLLARRICARMDEVRKSGTLSWLHPSAKVQVIVKYDLDPSGAMRARSIHAVSISTALVTGVTIDQAKAQLMDHVLKPILPAHLPHNEMDYNVHTTRTFYDAGASGRRTAADGCPQGECISGKDGSKISRCATYGARWAARSLVEAQLCRRCLVQLAYVPGAAEPASVHVHSYGTAHACGKNDHDLEVIVLKNFDFRPSCLKQDLSLTKPHFQRLSSCFGAMDSDCFWEKSKSLVT